MKPEKLKLKTCTTFSLVNRSLGFIKKIYVNIEIDIFFFFYYLIYHQVLFEIIYSNRNSFCDTADHVKNLRPERIQEDQ